MINISIREGVERKWKKMNNNMCCKNYISSQPHSSFFHPSVLEKNFILTYVKIIHPRIHQLEYNNNIYCYFTNTKLYLNLCKKYIFHVWYYNNNNNIFY